MLAVHPDVAKVKYVAGAVVAMSEAEQKGYQRRFGTPDKKDFEGGLKAFFSDPIVLNALLRKYPLFLWSLRDGNWPWVEALLKEALGAGDISLAFYNNVKTVVDNKNIPMNL